MQFSRAVSALPRRTFAQHHVRRLQGTPPRGTPRKTMRTLRHKYERGGSLTMLTAYDYPSALHADRAGVDAVLVGDSLGMVVLGSRTTQAVTLDDMVHHARAARRGVHDALLVADLPFGTYETSTSQAVSSAVRLVKEAGVDAVKLEGGRDRQHILSAVVDAGVAVMGHVGLQPQAVSRLGGFRAVGKSCGEAWRVLDDARAVEAAGAFAFVIECVPERLAGVVRRAVDIPTVGIGSGVECDGQVLVYHDMLGILSHPHHAKVAPKFSKLFAELGPLIDEAIREYCRQVEQGEFPSERYSPYSIPDKEFDDFLRQAGDLEVRKRAIEAREERQQPLKDAGSPRDASPQSTQGISVY